jgi:hypothetical protein
MANKLTNYLLTEQDVARALQGAVPAVFVKDYVAGKNNASSMLAQIDENTAAILVINGQITAINGQIVVINGQITTLTTNLNNHVTAQSAHGATGDIVGTDDYCTASVGGTVLLASAVANAAPVSTTPPAIVAAAGATYSQPYTQTQTDTINALRQNVIDLVAANNALVSAINQMLATERTAKQRAV